MEENGVREMIRVFLLGLLLMNAVMMYACAAINHEEENEEEQ